MVSGILAVSVYSTSRYILYSAPKLDMELRVFLPFLCV